MIETHQNTVVSEFRRAVTIGAQGRADKRLRGIFSNTAILQRKLDQADGHALGDVPVHNLQIC